LPSPPRLPSLCLFQPDSKYRSTRPTSWNSKSNKEKAREDYGHGKGDADSFRTVCALFYSEYTTKAERTQMDEIELATFSLGDVTKRRCKRFLHFCHYICRLTLSLTSADAKESL